MLRYSRSHKQGLEYYTLDCLRMPFDTTAMLFLFALFAGSLAASLSAALLYFNGSMTTPGVFRIFGRVRFLQHASRVLKSGLSHAYRSSVCSILFTGDITVSGMHLADSGLQLPAWVPVSTIQHISQRLQRSPAH